MHEINDWVHWENISQIVHILSVHYVNFLLSLWVRDLFMVGVGEKAGNGSLSLIFAAVSCLFPFEIKYSRNVHIHVCTARPILVLQKEKTKCHFFYEINIIDRWFHGDIRLFVFLWIENVSYTFNLFATCLSHVYFIVFSAKFRREFKKACMCCFEMEHPVRKGDTSYSYKYSNNLTTSLTQESNLSRTTHCNRMTHF